MKKALLLSLFLASIQSLFGQRSEDLVPVQAMAVVSINNVNLLQKISLDELVQYEFMEEVQQELFDGSTSGKTLKDSGIDFDQKLNVFFGVVEKYEVSGLTFGVENKQKLFEVFDDYAVINSDYKEIEFFESYFNRIAILNNRGILFRINPNMDVVNEITDSIWYARGNEYPWYDDDFEELFNILEEEGQEEIEFMNEMETEENTSNPTDEEPPVANDDPNTKTYYELRDSVEHSLHGQYLKEFCDELFIDQNSLIKNAPDFKEQLNHSSEGVYYSNNSSGSWYNQDLTTMKLLYPGFYDELMSLYEGNRLLGDMLIMDNNIELTLRAKYNDKLGSIYQSLTDTKFDKNVLKYIREDNSAFFTYNVSTRAAYEQWYEVVTPILQSSDGPIISSYLLMLELMDEYINKDALFGTYKGSLFGTYSGIKKIKTKKIEFDYDEENFEYIEHEVEAEEDMPIFAFGISTDRNDIAQRVLKHLEKINPNCSNQGKFWQFENAVLNAAPLYVLTQNDLFIMTNDENLVREYPNGYGDKAISKQMAKRAKKSGALYAYADLGKAIESIPRGIFNDEENEIIDVIRGKSGTMELTSSETSTTETAFHLMYNFDGEYENSGTYILDLINSLYVISK